VLGVDEFKEVAEKLPTFKSLPESLQRKKTKFMAMYFYLRKKLVKFFDDVMIMKMLVDINGQNHNLK